MASYNICLWSGPRNISTALMYSFAQRADTRVVDEPLYAHYLHVSGAKHPAREEVLQSQENDGQKVIEDLLYNESEKPVLFMKHMAHHLVDLLEDFLSETINILLIRRPAEVIHSFSKVVAQPKIKDIGIKRQYQLFRDLEQQGMAPLVIDSNDILRRPDFMLGQLCAAIGIPFDKAMLKWEPGARPEDGVWAPHWYTNVHQSSGFQPYAPKEFRLAPMQRLLAAECQPYYDHLYKQAIK